MDLKTVVAIAALAVGVLMIFGPQLLNLLNTVKSEAKPIIFDTPERKPDMSDIECLESLVKLAEDKETADYLIDKVAPKLIRKRLKESQ